MKKISGMIFMACLCLLLVWGAVMQPEGMDTMEDSPQEEEGIRLTVWLDEDNEYDVRAQIGLYEKTKGNALLTDEEPLPDIQWDLVPKSYLSPEQYRKELTEALERGEGPDLIYMDAWNGVDPKELVETGALAQLEDAPTHAGESFQWLPGALEAGRKDGKNYVLPLYMEYPLVFGLPDDLEQAGLKTDGAYSSMGEFLDALLAAQEKTGKQIFEDTAAIDWLEQYYMPKDAAQAEELKGKLEQIRALCGENDGSFDAYKELDAGNCLLGGCGMYDHKKLGRNLSLFSEEQAPVFFSIPDSAGDVTGIITHAMAVNAGSANIEVAKAALTKVFMFFYRSWTPDLPVVDNERYGELLSCADAAKMQSFAIRAVSGFGISSQMGRAFGACTLDVVKGMSYVQEFGGRSDTGTDETEIKEAPEVLSIFYTDRGEGKDFFVTKWLEQAAASYEQAHSDVHIQLLPVDTDIVSTYLTYVDRMDPYGVAPDVQILDMSYLMDPAGQCADVSELLKGSAAERDFLPELFKDGIQYAGCTAGLPVWAEEYGIWCSREQLAEAGLPEDWLPEDAETFAAGLEKLRGTLQNNKKKKNAAAVMPYDLDAHQAMALFLSDDPEGLFVQQEDGKWYASKEDLASYLTCLKEWKDQGLVAPDEKKDRKQLAKSLASGKIGAVIGSRRLAPWFGGSYGSGLTEEQQEDMIFLPVFPAVSVRMFTISTYSAHAGVLVDFWQEALQDPGYGEAIREEAYLPITELPEMVRYIVPEAQVEQSIAFSDLMDIIWDSEASAAELLDQQDCYDWIEDQEQ